MFHVELAPLGGILGPLKSDLGVFWAKIPLHPYNVKTQKTHFLKTLLWADFDLLESNCRHLFLHKNQKIYHIEFFFLLVHVLVPCVLMHIIQGGFNLSEGPTRDRRTLVALIPYNHA